MELYVDYYNLTAYNNDFLIDGNKDQEKEETFSTLHKGTLQASTRPGQLKTSSGASSLEESNPG